MLPVKVWHIKREEERARGKEGERDRKRLGGVTKYIAIDPKR